MLRAFIAGAVTVMALKCRALLCTWRLASLHPKSMTQSTKAWLVDKGMAAGRIALPRTGTDRWLD